MGGGVILVETGHCNVQSRQLKRSSTLERIKCCGEKKGKNQSWRRQSWRWQNNKMFTGPVLRIILELLFVFWLLREKYENCLSLEFLLSKSLNTSFDYHLLLAINDVTILTFKQNLRHQSEVTLFVSQMLILTYYTKFPKCLTRAWFLSKPCAKTM